MGRRFSWDRSAEEYAKLYARSCGAGAAKAPARRPGR
jgi:hypothetical protein